jgi:C2H2 type zinc finger protein
MGAEIVFRCEVCDLEFSTLEARRAHDTGPHAAAAKARFMCAACGAPFRTPSELAAHARAQHSH